MSFVKIIDERLNMQDAREAKFAVFTGPRSNAVIIPPQNLNTQNLNYILNNVGANVGRTRILWLNPTITFNYTGTALPTTASGWESVVGYKFAPFNRNITAVQHIINDATETYLTYQIIDFIGRLRNRPECVDYLENFQPDNATIFNTGSSSNLSPLNSYSGSQNGQGVFKPRNLGISISNTTATTATFTCSWWEPLITPFSSVPERGQNLPALFSINGESIQITLNGLTDTLAFGQGISSFGLTTTPSSVVINSCPLYVEYITGRHLHVPENSLTQFCKYQRFNNVIGTIPAGSTNQQTSVQINAQTMPSLIAVMIKPDEGQRTATNPDFYARIDNIQVQLDNGTTLLNSSCVKQLYQMSYQNGLTDTFFQFNQLNATLGGNYWGSGSVLFINPAKDLSLMDEEGLSNCSAGKYTLNIQLTYSNPTNSAMTNMNCIAYTINDALLKRHGRSYTTSLLSYTREEVENAKRGASHVELNEYFNSKNDNLMLSGGYSMGGGLGSLLKKAWQHRKEIVDNAKQAYNLGKQAYGAYKSMKGGAEDLDLYYE